MSEKREKRKGLGEILTFIVGIVIVYFLAKSGAKPAWQKSLDKSLDNVQQATKQLDSLKINLKNANLKNIPQQQPKK